MSQGRSWMSVMSAGFVALVLTLGSLALAVGVAPIASAATGVTPFCGQMLSNDDFFLQADVGPCGTEFGLMLSSARLDMRGHVVRGNDGGNLTGILLSGSGSVLERGTVRDAASQGVQVSGDGSHVVRGVTSKSNAGIAFEVRSPNNILRNNLATGNVGAGFFVDNDSNFLTANSARGNESGFWVNEFNAGNRLWNNRATSNGTGFRDNASGSTYAGNRAIANNETGFSINGTDTIVLNNAASRTRFAPSAGFAVDGEGNTLGSNKAVENKADGFFVTGDNNVLVTNRGKDNASSDLVDAHGDCLSNRWEGNKGTADPVCAKSEDVGGPPPQPIPAGQGGCGPIAPGGSYFFIGDVGPCVNQLVVQSATLDLRGHAFSGDGQGNGGISLTGVGSVLRNGVVRDGSNGVQVQEIGSHTISGIVAKNNEISGFDIDSPNNIVRNSRASGNGADGFKVFGAEGNLLGSNAANGNGSGGFSVNEAPNGRLWSNISIANRDGYSFGSVAGGNVLSANAATRNSDEGFDVRSGENVLLNNAATRNASLSDPGFAIGDGNTLGSSRAIENRSDGIVAAGNDNVLVSNRGRDNAGIDLRDTKVDCGTNRWEGNKGTRDPVTCIG